MHAEHCAGTGLDGAAPRAGIAWGSGSNLSVERGARLDTHSAPSPRHSIMRASLSVSVSRVLGKYIFLSVSHSSPHALKHRVTHTAQTVTHTKPTGVFNCSALPLRGTPPDREVGNLLPACDWSHTHYSVLVPERHSLILHTHTARATPYRSLYSFSYSEMVSTLLGGRSGWRAQ